MKKSSNFCYFLFNVYFMFDQLQQSIHYQLKIRMYQNKNILNILFFLLIDLQLIKPYANRSIYYIQRKFNSQTIQSQKFKFEFTLLQKVQKVKTQSNFDQAKMWIKSGKQQQKQINRLKQILFPKNKKTYKRALQELNSNQIFENQTKRQNSQSEERQTNIIFSKVPNTNDKKKHTKISNLSLLNKNEEVQQEQDISFTKQVSKDQQALIKTEINKLKYEINNMLEKWNDQEQIYQIQDQIYQNQQQQESRQVQNIFTRSPRDPNIHHQEQTQRYYLNKINQINKNLQKYNAYLYGIKQASQQMLQILPIQRNQSFQKNYFSNIYKMYYFALLLTNYLVFKIQKIKRDRLRKSFLYIKMKADEQKEKQTNETQKNRLNKINNMFLKRNLLDKGFKKWRVITQLLAFNSKLTNKNNIQISHKPHLSSLNEDIENLCPNKWNQPLYPSEFLSNNILSKQKTLLFLQNYLHQKSPISIERRGQVSQQIEILLLDQQNNELFTFIDQNQLQNQWFNNQKIVNSRVQNILSSLRQIKQPFSVQNNYQLCHLNSKERIKRYKIKVKNSITKMCIDCEKVLRISRISQSDVYKMQVDGSIRQQILTRTCKTQRNKQQKGKKQQSNKMNIRSKFQQVYYSEEYISECLKSTYSDCILYPLIYSSGSDDNNHLLGIVRQYIGSSSGDSCFGQLAKYQIHSLLIDFVSQMVLTSWQLGGKWEAMKRENQVIERNDVIKILKIMKRLKNIGRIQNIIQLSNQRQKHDNKRILSSQNKQNKLSQTNKLSQINKLSQTNKQNTNKLDYEISQSRSKLDEQMFNELQNSLSYLDLSQQSSLKNKQSKQENHKLLLTVYKQKIIQDVVNIHKEKQSLIINNSKLKEIYKSKYSNQQNRRSEVQQAIRDFWQQDSSESIKIIRFQPGCRNLRQNNNTAKTFILVKPFHDSISPQIVQYGKYLFCIKIQSEQQQNLISQSIGNQYDQQKLKLTSHILPSLTQKFLSVLFDHHKNIINHFKTIQTQQKQEQQKLNIRTENQLKDFFINEVNKLVQIQIQSNNQSNNQRQNQRNNQRNSYKKQQRNSYIKQQSKQSKHTGVINQINSFIDRLINGEFVYLNGQNQHSLSNNLNIQSEYKSSFPQIKIEYQIKVPSIQNYNQLVIKVQKSFSLNTNHTLPQNSGLDSKGKVTILKYNKEKQSFEKSNSNQKIKTNKYSGTLSQQHIKNIHIQLIQIKIQTNQINKMNEQASTTDPCFHHINKVQQHIQLIKEIIHNFIEIIKDLKYKQLRNKTQKAKQQIKTPLTCHEINQSSIFKRIVQITHASQQQNSYTNKSLQYQNSQQKYYNQKNKAQLAYLLKQMIQKMILQFLKISSIQTNNNKTINPDQIKIKINQANLQILINSIIKNYPRNQHFQSQQKSKQILKLQSFSLIPQSFSLIPQSLKSTLHLIFGQSLTDKQNKQYNQCIQNIFTSYLAEDKNQNQKHYLTNACELISRQITNNEINKLLRGNVIQIMSNSGQYSSSSLMYAQNSLKSLKSLPQLITIQFQASNYTDYPTILDLMNNQNLIINNSQNSQNFIQILRSTLQKIIIEYVRQIQFVKETRKIKLISSALNLLIHRSNTLSSLKQQSLLTISNQPNQNLINTNNTDLHNFSQSTSILLKNIMFSFKQILKYTNNQVYKAKKILNLTKFIKKNQISILNNAFNNFSLFIKHKSYQKHLKFINQKILSHKNNNQSFNSQDSLYQHQQIHLKYVQVIKNLVYNKILSPTLNKIHNFSKFNRIKNFSQYRLKRLSDLMNNLSQRNTILNNNQTKKVFIKLKQIQKSKEIQQIIYKQKVKLFTKIIQSTRIYKTNLINYRGYVFKLIKSLKNVSYSKQNNQFLSNPSFQLSLNEKITQCQTMCGLKKLLTQELNSYDIWIRLIKKNQNYTKLTHFNQTLNPNSHPFNQTTNSISSFQQTFRFNHNNQNNLQNQLAIKEDSQQRLTKEQLNNVYLSEYKYLIFQASNQIIFVSKSVQPLSSTLQSSSPSALSFKQKQKLISISRSLRHFLRAFKNNFNTKITFLSEIYSHLSNKLVKHAFNKTRIHIHNSTMIQSYQLNDKMYQIGVQMENVKEKFQRQQKQITDNKNEYNRLIKKQAQYETRTEKYQNNIKVLNKMLSFYQSGNNKTSINNTISQEEQISSNSRLSSYNSKNISLQQFQVLSLSLTKWRQINTKQKFQQLRVRNLQKSVTLFTKISSRILKSLIKRQLTQGFQSVLAYALYTKHVDEQRQRKQYQLQSRKQQQLKRQQIQKKLQDQLIIEGRRRKYEEEQSSHREYFNNIQQNNQNLCYYEEQQQSAQGLSQQLLSYQPSSKEQTITNSLAEQLQQQFTQLNCRLMTFQKNHFNTQSEEDQSSQRGFRNEIFDTTEEGSALISYKAPNNTEELKQINKKTTSPDVQQISEKLQKKMTQQEKIRFQLQRMKMKKPQYNKENITVTSDQYDMMNKNSNYKLGGKTLRFLKRMGKLDSSTSRN